ncbi:hypothetical protein [Halobacillus amylolyticus]|uniref:Lipoprotein n=1 Tax=Halobacillus amylolyticus TaxID=2932259 RepID=A0ABY4HH88_9BACI|nr:hypothetical protein [Halobacillus amylolyticus]UOR13752.1 hypothetical protein MUO15_10075 [Halobacillus amylolyticus]
MKKITILVGTVLAFTLVIFMSSYFGGSQTAQGQNLKDSIKQSMKDTAEKNEKVEAFHKELNDKFKEEGFEGSLSTSIDNHFFSKQPSVTVRVKEKRYKKEHESEIKQFIEGVVKPYNFGEVAIHVKVEDRGIGDLSEEDRRLQELTHELFEISRKVLEQEGYNQVIAMRIDPRKSKQMIYIKIEGTESYYNNVKEDIERLVHDTVSAKKGLDYPVKVERRSEAEIRDMKWSPIFHSIMEETDKKFDKVSGFAYSFHPKPLQIIIKTSLSDGWFSWGVKKQAEEIEKYVKQVIEIKREELSIEKIPYKIIIRGTKANKLN